jgi:hypothetical protein
MGLYPKLDHTVSTAENAEQTVPMGHCREVVHATVLEELQRAAAANV